MSAHRPPGSPRGAIGQFSRHGARVLDSERHDPYQVAGKYSEPTQCGSCHAVYHHGRWQWASAPPASHMTLCPACRRLSDKLPAGVVTLEGAFVVAHRTELVQLARHEAEHEGKEHPLNRIMAIDDLPDRVQVSTTDIHLPQRIGEALERAYDGELEVRYGSDDYSVRVTWRR